MDDKNVISSSQHGFTKGKSCLTSLIAFYDDTTAWADEGESSGYYLPQLQQGFQSCLAQHLHSQTQEVWSV